LTENHARHARQQLVTRLFSAGIPSLWCPPLTHFDADGWIDSRRIHRHLEWIAPHARGILVPGSTGEGWELTSDQTFALLSVVLDAARRLDLKVLIGVLKHDTAAMVETITDTVDWLRWTLGVEQWSDVAAESGVVGFTVCPPKGSDLTQGQIAASLKEILGLGYPVALYQLPQVTGNEISPEAVAELARDFPHFFLFKDTSGQDRVALSGADLGGVFLVRGAEGGYDRWTKSAGGPYDGLLLSSANCFAAELASIQRLLRENRPREAAALSARVERVITRCFTVVASFPAGNAFTNANKTLDHVMAFGEHAVRQPPPLLHSGRRLPTEYIEEAAAALREESLWPQQGYFV
jgi:dihydrodipicolinate synthase/N-acetylneuraminate lyase